MQRLLALLIGASLSLAALSTYLALRIANTAAPESPSIQALLADEDARQLLIEELAASSGGFYDSFSDPDVGRIFLPGLESDRPHGIVSNSRGMREREYDLPKPAGHLRVVVLGDSFVVGASVGTDQRLGALLERALREGAASDAIAIEVLHIAVPSWNAVASSHYLRRHVSDLRPDLVVHVLNENDVEDCAGVRGFGRMASFAPQRRGRSDGMLMIHHPRLRMGITTSNYLASGLDGESRGRYAEAASALEAVAAATHELGGRYVALLHFPGSTNVARRLLVPGLEPDQVAYTSLDLQRPEFLAVDRFHWNPVGHERVANLIYGMITERELLPDLALPDRAEATAELEALHEAGHAAANRPPRFRGRTPAQISSAIDFEALTLDSAGQVHGGVDAEGYVAPYASMILRNQVTGDGGAPVPGTRVRLEARCLPAPELGGATVQVWADELHLGQIELRADEPLELEWELPAALADRRFLSLRLEASDYVYRGRDLQRCVALRLMRVAVLP